MSECLHPEVACLDCGERMTAMGPPAPALDAERRLLVGLIASALPPVDEEGNLAADVAEGMAEQFFAARGVRHG